MRRRFLTVLVAAPLLVPSAAYAQSAQGQEQPQTEEKKAEPQEGPTLELSMDEAVKRALENNVDIQVQRFIPKFDAEVVRSAHGIYDPFLNSQINEVSVTTPQTSAFSGGSSVTTKTFTYNFGVSQYLPTGAQVSVVFDNSRTSSDSVFVLFNPNFGSTLTLNVTQPLLKNFASDLNREQLSVAKRNKEISDFQFEQTVITTVAAVKGLYYDYLTALDTLDAARKNLALAQQLVNENKIKVKVGTLAPLDVIQAESEVASREQDVITAEATITDSEDNLKAAIFPKDDPATWAIHIVPTDKSTPTLAHVNIDSALQEAMEKRTDLRAAKKQVELQQVVQDYAKSQTLPQLDLVAFYGTQGVGGTEFLRNGIGGPITQVVPGGYGDALSQTFSTQFPTWKIGVNFSYPIGNRAALGNFAQARLNKEQSEAVLRRLEIEVATEVRSAGRAVETNIKRVEAARAARVLEEQTLDAEVKKFAAGMSTNYLVTQVQRDLANAVVTEIQAVNAFNKSVINFDRTKVAGPGGLSTTAFSTSLTGTTGATTTGTTTPATGATTTPGTSATPANPLPTVVTTLRALRPDQPQH
jgi:outer membrane protein TolC